VPEGSDPADALRQTVRLARAAERLGYRRYWVAEHHNTRSLAGTAPEVLAGVVASATSTIRVGSGGVLLPYRTPLMAAEAFRVLHALFPDRIDLGIGRAAGTDALTEEALRRGPPELGEELFPQQVAALVGFLHGTVEESDPYARVRAMPAGPGAPELWLLGSSSKSSACAAYLGLALSFAHFITPAYGPQIVRSYRKGFRPSEVLSAPVVNVAVSVVCAETDAAAEELASTADLWRLGPEGTARRGILPAGEVAAQPLTDLERELIAQDRSKLVVGAPDRVRARMTALAAEFDVDELIVVTVCHDQQARLRSYELLAEAFGLEPGESDGN
jgi:luciferase family oxidoreductase group 1